MIDKLKKILGIKPSAELKELVNQGALILDVRSREEYTRGHIHGSINISLDQLRNNLHKFKDKNMPIITCCASGMRSASAKDILEQNGFTRVYNGGGWHSLNYEIQR
jgi:rhodanese-related sulfurtransferase